jgi:hypothetical protein
MNLSRSAAADRGGRGVGQRMVVQPVAGRQRALEERLHPVGTIVDQGEWRHAAWGDAQNLLEQFRPPERQAGAAEHLGQSIDVDLAMVQADQQPEPALPVLDERFLQRPPGMWPVCRSAVSRCTRVDARRIGRCPARRGGAAAGPGRPPWAARNQRWLWPQAALLGMSPDVICRAGRRDYLLRARGVSCEDETVIMVRASGTNGAPDPAPDAGADPAAGRAR